MKHIFIINTYTNKNIATLEELIHKVARKYQLDYAIYKTMYAHHAYELAQAYADRYSIVYAVGGDGTIFEVLNGMDLNSTLAIIPFGSGNDFYRMICKKRPLEKVIEDTINGTVAQVDYGTINDRRFLNTSSIGIDSMINYEASRLIHQKKINKSFAYTLSIIKNAIDLRPFSLRLIIDDEVRLDKEFYICSIMNGAYYGNGAYAAPLAKLDDGFFDVVLAYDIKTHNLIPALIKYLKGRHLNDQRFKMIKAKKITIIAQSNTLGQSDGESEYEIRREIICHHKGLKLLVPKNAYFLRSSS